MVAETGFWLMLALVAYIYAGYPVGVMLLAPLLRRPVAKAQIAPRVTVVVSAYNEERVVGRTVANILGQNYPRSRLDVIVVSDGSTDRTDALVRRLAARAPGRLRLLRQEPRQGKTQALNLAVAESTGDIIVFADANATFAPGAVLALVRSFADPGVGYVTGKMVYTGAEASGVGSGCATFMRYENALRAAETRLGSIVGVDGGVDAIRRELYAPMRADELPDFALPLHVVEQGKRVVYEPDAVLYEPALAEAHDEFRMRVRVALRALWTLYDRRSLLNPLRHPLFAWQLLSHKALRYVAFIPLLALLVVNAAIASRHPVYQWFLALQLGCYALAALGHWLRRSPAVTGKLLAPYYFILVNAACVMAFWKFLHRQKIVLWTPRLGA